METHGTSGGSPRHYAFLLVCWGTETWVATVEQNEAPILVVENGKIITTTPSGLTLERAIELATERRDAVIVLRRRTRGKPDVVHTVIEPSGDPALVDERMKKTPPVAQKAIPRWLVVLSGLEVAVAAPRRAGPPEDPAHHRLALSPYFSRARSASAATWPKAGHCGPSTTRSRATRASSFRPL
jgi:hypothetical protein